MADNATQVYLMPKQKAFVLANQKQCLYSGAYGAGKTRALCYRALRLAARHEAARVGLTRKTHTSLKQSTLRTLLERDGELPPVVTPGTYVQTKRAGEEKIKLNGAGEILFFGCDDHLKIGSMQMSDCCVDEAVELDRDEWNMLLGRCRVSFKLADGTKNIQTLAGACNPGSPGHFLHKLFYEDNEHNERFIVSANTRENWYLDPGYITELCKTFTGAALARYVNGIWSVTEGAVYPMFSNDLHIRHRPNTWLRYVVGVDYGFRNPMAMRVHGVDGDNRSHVVSEFYEAGVTISQFVKICKVTARHYDPITFVVDPSAAELISTMRRARLNVTKANNDVLAGVGAVQVALMKSGGSPRLTMEPSCRKGNNEYLSYRWKDNDAKDVPLKLDDHAVDCDRYALMYINNPKGMRKLASAYQANRIPFRDMRSIGAGDLMVSEGAWN